MCAGAAEVSPVAKTGSKAVVPGAPKLCSLLLSRVPTGTLTCGRSPYQHESIRANGRMAACGRRARGELSSAPSAYAGKGMHATDRLHVCSRASTVTRCGPNVGVHGTQSPLRARVGTGLLVRNGRWHGCACTGLRTATGL